MTKTLELVFNLTNGKTLTISISTPKTNVTQLEINQVMDTIVGANVFSRDGEAITSKKSARIVERDVTDYAV